MSMAISASFKQQCPSCEALVPIKDGSMIGKKVDCPKCKYRFVVEDPVAKDKKAVGADKVKQNGSADAAAAKKKETAVTAKATAKAKPVVDDEVVEVVEADEPEAVEVVEAITEKPKSPPRSARPAPAVVVEEDEEEERPAKKKKKQPPK